MRTLTKIFENNKEWALGIHAQRPEFFSQLSKIQNPQYLWIGCSDSRVPANDIVGLLPGELFVHRNVGNVVVHTDLNCLSVLQYAVDVLKVKEVIVCGHYGCGGIKAALDGARLGLIDNWIRHIQDVMGKHRGLLESISDLNIKSNVLCSLNVIEQASNVCQTTIVQDAWSRGQELNVHALIYDLNDGLLRDFGFSASSLPEYEHLYRTVIADKRFLS